MNDARRVLIAGCGDVGMALGHLLLAGGYQVVGLRRQDVPLGPGIQVIRADLSRPETLTSLPPAHAVVFAASADERTETAYHRTYVEGMRNLIGALKLQPQPPDRLIFTSSTAVYGQDDGSTVDEHSKTEPVRFPGKILLEAERETLSTPWTSTVVRLAGIYGRNRHGLIKRVHDGNVALNNKMTNRIHVEDCAGMLAHILQMERAEECYVGVDDAPCTTAEIGTWMATQLGIAAPEVGPNVEARNKMCSNARTRRTGFFFKYPSYKEGYPDIVRAFRAQLGPATTASTERD